MSISSEFICIGILFPFLVSYAAASDLLTMKISNSVNGCIFFSFIYFAVASGMSAEVLAWHVCAGVLTLAVSFGMFARGWIGGGDAKLAAATALWLGLAHLGDFIIIASVLGGMLTLAIVYARSFPLPAASIHLPFVTHLHSAKTDIPYGIALSAAALIVMSHAAGFERLALS